MADKVLIFDSHPVQYKAPVYRELQRLLPDAFEVIYATDASVRGGSVDRDFGIEVAWDTPLLEGYPFRVLRNERGTPLSSPRSLTGAGLFRLIRQERPAAILLTQFRYEFDVVAYLSALWWRVPVLIRQETQDETFRAQRGWIKSLLRALAYRVLYAPVRHAFAFGRLNEAHLLRHGFKPEQLVFARFSVVDACRGPDEELQRRRLAARERLGIAAHHRVIGFFGKLIPKKNPDLILKALACMTPDQRRNLTVLYVGSGELMDTLKALALDVHDRFGVPVVFAGFVNQRALPDHYLATDVMSLPSRHMGEAWGLVVNEALHAGCAVAITEGVGCHVEFGHLDRVRVTAVEDAQALACSLAELLAFERSFDWARDAMAAYSTEAAAEAMASLFRREFVAFDADVDPDPDPDAPLLEAGS